MIDPLTTSAVCLHRGTMDSDRHTPVDLLTLRGQVVLMMSYLVSCLTRSVSTGNMFIWRRKYVPHMNRIPLTWSSFVLKSSMGFYCEGGLRLLQLPVLWTVKTWTDTFQTSPSSFGLTSRRRPAERRSGVCVCVSVCV